MNSQLRLGIVVSIVVGLVLAVLVTDRPGRSSASLTMATPCAEASPIAAAGTPIAACLVIGEQVGRGTPAAVEGLTITLSISSGQAGPVVLTVRVTDASGDPVDGAAVVVKARHLDMDMGVFPHDALPSGPGTYVAERVGMGMGGDWRVEVDVSRPGHPPVAVFFDVTMEGLR